MATLLHNLGRVWHHEDGAIQGVLRRGQLAWLPPAHQLRAERLRQARALWEGRHRAYFLGEGRTQHSFPPLRPGSDEAYYQPLNMLTLVVRKLGDLLFSDPARVYAKSPGVQDRINAISDRSWLSPTLLDAGTQGAWAGDAVLEIAGGPGAATIGMIDADEIYPIGRPGPDRQYRAYVRYATDVITEGTRSLELLLETRYLPGRIERKLYRLDQTDALGPRRVESLPLDKWPEERDGRPLPEQELTGLERPNLVYVPNELRGLSDFDGLIEAQDLLTAKHSQLARVIAKHADPNVAFHESSFDENGQIMWQGRAFAFRTKEDIPQYITWNAELEAALRDRDNARSALAMQAETPLSLLGVKDDSSVDSARKMRLAASPALAKTQRKALIWQPAIRLAMAMAIEVETGFRVTEPIGVEMRDGLPDDELDRAQVIATLRSAQVLSRRRGIRMQWLDEASTDEEMAALEAEAQHDLPSILFGEQPTHETEAA